jgi:hypothetical protein
MELALNLGNPGLKKKLEKDYLAKNILNKFVCLNFFF